MKYTCRQITELLIDYVEEELPEDQKRILDRHICGCPPCMYYLTTYRQTIELTHQLPDEPMPSELEQRLLRSLEAIRKEES